MLLLFPPKLPMDTLTYNGAQLKHGGVRSDKLYAALPYQELSEGHGSLPAILVAPAACSCHVPVRQGKHLEKWLVPNMD